MRINSLQEAASYLCEKGLSLRVPVDNPHQAARIKIALHDLSRTTSTAVLEELHPHLTNETIHHFMPFVLPLIAYLTRTDFAEFSNETNHKYHVNPVLSLNLGAFDENRFEYKESNYCPLIVPPTPQDVVTAARLLSQALCFPARDVVKAQLLRVIHTLIPLFVPCAESWTLMQTGLSQLAFQVCLLINFLDI